MESVSTLAVFLDVGDPLELPGQRPDVSDLLCNGGRRGWRDGRESGHIAAFPRWCITLAGGVMRLCVHGRSHIHRKWPELHGEKHRRALGRADAFVWRVHGLFRNGVDADLCGRDAGLFPLIGCVL